MNKIFLTIALAIILAGCATPYDPSGSANLMIGGFQVKRVKHNLFAVHFVGNGYSTQERANDFALLKSAETVLINGYRYFILFEGEGLGLSAQELENKPVSTKKPDASEQMKTLFASSGWGRSLTVIGALHQPPEQVSVYYDASKVVEILKAKYELDLTTMPQGFDSDAVEIEFDVDPIYSDLPSTNPDSMLVRRSYKERGFDGILLGAYGDFEYPFPSILNSIEPFKKAASEIGAEAIILEQDLNALRMMGTEPIYGFLAQAYLVPDASLGIQWEPGELKNQKYVVRRFYPNSLATQAGMKIGDKVLSINGIDLLDQQSHNEDWLTWKPGDTISITVVRDGAEKVLEVEAIENQIL